MFLFEQNQYKLNTHLLLVEEPKLSGSSDHIVRDDTLDEDRLDHVDEPEVDGHIGECLLLAAPASDSVQPGGGGEWRRR